MLANENRGKNGDAILQCGPDDGGSEPDDIVATLSAFKKLKCSGANTVDCAMAELSEGIEAEPATMKGLGKLKGIGDAFLDEGAEVAKIGRTTGKTGGRVTAFELDDVYVDFDLGTLRFDNQFEIEGDGRKPFSDGGDSGSLIVNAERRAVALLFAGTDQGGTNGKGLTYANPIRDVLKALDAELEF